MEEKKINWLSLFIKVIIIFVFVIIVIWLISKIINRNKLSESFINNINNMQEKSKEYFKTIDLPLERGQNIKITLKEMLEKDLLDDSNKNIENSCDLNKSYSNITREKEKYIIETTLKCGKEKETIITNLNLKECRNCAENKDKITDKEENEAQSNGSNISEQNKENTITYYEHVKETTTYTKWMKGNKTGNNIENKYEYYAISSKEYYSIGVANKKDIKDGEVTYTLKLNNVPNEKYYFTTIKESEYFDVEEKEKYIKEKNITLKSNDKIDVDKIEKHSLKEEHYTYKLSPYYRKGSFYVDVTIKIKNTNNIEAYQNNKINSQLYLIPIKFVVRFASNKILETKPLGEYETISYYRYIEKNREVIWSTEEYVEGYTKTGKTQVK